MQCKNKRGGKCTVMCGSDQVCKTRVDLNWCDVGGVNVFTNIYLYILPLNQYLQFKNHPLPYPPMKLLLIQSTAEKSNSPQGCFLAHFVKLLALGSLNNLLQVSSITLLILYPILALKVIHITERVIHITM